RSGGESCTCPSSVVHGDAQQHGPTAVRGGITSLKQTDRHARRHEGMCGEGNVMQEHQRQRRHIAERLSSAGLSLQEDTLRKAILMAFAAPGQAPSVHALAHARGLPLTLVLAACRTLAAADLIVWEDATTQVGSAYPFSGRQTAHQVLLGGHILRYALCAIDA